MENLSNSDIKEIKALIKDIATALRKVVLCLEELNKFISVEDSDDGNTE